MDKSKIKILVVDDEKGLCAGVQEVLRREGYFTDAATDVESASKFASRQLYNLVLTDMKLPGSSGLELLRRVKARSPDTAFILMTAYGTVESAVQAMKEGVHDYLSKPLDMQRLRASVLKAQDPSAAGDAAQRSRPGRVAGQQTYRVVPQMGRW